MSNMGGCDSLKRFNKSNQKSDHPGKLSKTIPKSPVLMTKRRADQRNLIDYTNLI